MICIYQTCTVGLLRKGPIGGTRYSCVDIYRLVYLLNYCRNIFIAKIRGNSDLFVKIVIIIMYLIV